ncbi:hypothetical protein GGU10DRAFT_367330 [Lentinula aff. detonsa]|uniref:Uncharacterized protein n=1 Tax=Lentinula aff. detonsa TaxID=2804958 RepID=A0AA38NJC0_9AGAR|nr:hypothetical protein GGU10DRAFT_367330 [Lentinula aff. detonsa]
MISVVTAVVSAVSPCLHAQNPRVLLNCCSRAFETAVFQMLEIFQLGTKVPVLTLSFCLHISLRHKYDPMWNRHSFRKSRC